MADTDPRSRNMRAPLILRPVELTALGPGSTMAADREECVVPPPERLPADRRHNRPSLPLRPILMGAVAALVFGFVLDIGPWTAITGKLLGTADAQEVLLDAETATPSQADRAALRYFAREGDVERLEAELRRLRALYPDWEPPRDLLEPGGLDEDVQRAYALVGDQEVEAARQVLADRRRRDPEFEPPDRLMRLIELAEVRGELEEASDAGNYSLVLSLAAANEGLLTCNDVDALWRVAEAFVETDRPDRALDAYAYVISQCSDERVRASSLQKAAEALAPERVLELFELGSSEPASSPFGEARLGIVRAAVARGGEEEGEMVPQAYLDLLAEFARTGTNIDDAMLVGFYLFRTGFPAEAAQWFRFALDNGLGPDAAEGYILALRATGDREDAFLAREVAYQWREQTPELMEAYLDAMATLLSADERGQVSIEDVEQRSVDRFVPVVIEQRDAIGAQALGWYSFNTCQFIIAEEWFITSANWVPTEAAIFGLALTRLRLGDQEGFEAVVEEWGPLYESVRVLSRGEILDPADPVSVAENEVTGDVGGESVICDPVEREELRERIVDQDLGTNGPLVTTEAGSITAGSIPVRQLDSRPEGSERPAIPRRSVVIRPQPIEREENLLLKAQGAGPTPLPEQQSPIDPPLPRPEAARVAQPPAITPAGRNEDAGDDSIVRQRGLQEEPRLRDTRAENGPPRRLRVRDGETVSTVERRVRGGATTDLDREVRDIVSRPRSTPRPRAAPAGDATGGTAAQRALSARQFNRCIAITDEAIRNRTLTASDAAARGFCLLELRRPVEAAQAFKLAKLSARVGSSTRADAVYGSTLAALASNLTNEAAIEATRAPLSRARRTQLQIGILTQRALAANRDERYTEAVQYLDQRARIAPLQKDLMLLRGFAYLNAGDLSSAERLFDAVDRAASDPETRNAVNVIRERRLPPSFRNQINTSLNAN